MNAKPLSRLARRRAKPLDRKPRGWKSWRCLMSHGFRPVRAKLEGYLATQDPRARCSSRTKRPIWTRSSARPVERGYVDDESLWPRESGRSCRTRLWRPAGGAGVMRRRASKRNCATRSSRANTPRRAALVLARKRGFGPFERKLDAEDEERKLREKRLAAMLRAGHDFDMARRVVEAREREGARGMGRRSTPRT